MKLLRGLAFVIIVPALAGAAPVFGQDLVSKALSSFPPDTVRLEFSSPSTLRKLPNYASLREHYMGPRLKKLIDTMSELGVAESDVDQLVLGWSADGSDVNLYGFASGRFHPNVLDQRAAARNIPPEAIGSKTGYCLGAGLETECVVVLSPTEGAFGTLNTLTQIMSALDSGGGGLESNTAFANVVKQEQSGAAPIWGVAVASAVASWFKGWMPSQNEVALDWGKVFQGVDILGYKIQTGSNVQLNLKMFCKSGEDAAALRQVLEGLKLAQQIAWQNQYPNQPNPFQNMGLTQTGDQIGVTLVANYSEIGGAAGGAVSQ